ncbi:unnamed protein product [Aureobasidium vineae]|uniref:Uncharacterized protein n=1 Tax=Aureobasidium vineae TaxID=2773715 RepID=A0A9N8PIZ7_9PEZI|nr:unnamed protein product [Aureobasidium vineae]
MSSDQPRRRFDPTPVETSSKSNRQAAQPEENAAPRRFNVQPAETTTRSSKDTNTNSPSPLAAALGVSPSPPRRFSPTPVETSTKSSRETQRPQQPVRRFAPEPVENSVKSSKDKTDSPPQSIRRFSPEPVETSTKTNRQADPAAEKPKSRLLPQPIEMTSNSNRSKSKSPQSKSPQTNSPQTRSPPNEAVSPTSQPQDAPVEKPKRKFAPQLIDTSSRTRKNSDEKPSWSANHRTDISPGEESRVAYNNIGQQITIANRESTTSPTEYPRFIMPFARRKDRSDSARSHSFRMPELETIESSESEPSAPPSLSTSPSSNDFSLGAAMEPVNPAYKHATRIRESVDETFSRYLLELEGRKAQAKLQEQALAAFPNSDIHEPVAHFMNGESEDEDEEMDDRPATWEGHDDDDYMMNVRTPHGRGSTHGTYEVREMHQHFEEMEQERKAAGTTRRKSSVKPSPWWNPAGHDFAGSNYPDSEARAMRDRARPPMLGTDLTFPRSASPEPARFDVTQGSNQLRSQMCYLTEQSQIEVSPEGLWGGKKASGDASLHQKSVQKSQHTIYSQKSTTSQNGGGLWGGFCVDDAKSGENGLAPPTSGTQTGLMTPAVEPPNPFETGFSLPPQTILPKTPLTPPENVDFHSIDIILSEDQDLDEVMEREFPDSFVTQVYNYLSLGYPTIARAFDEELCKISHVPISDLRHDDEIAKNMPRGYIRLGEDFEGRGDGTNQLLEEGGCARWTALKKYIREWARQEKNMVKTGSSGTGLGGNWGTGARRGSWAW